jgi:hypothetical protein
MNHLPKFKDFEAPEGYFDRLPDQILAKSRGKKKQIWIRFATAAALLIGLGLSWQAGIFSPKQQELSSEDLALLYIESQVWTSEDILSMTDDPNAILDQIIAEEMPLPEDLWSENELNWF